MARVMKGSRRTTEGVGLADDTDLGRSTEVLLMYIVPKWTLNLFTCEWDVVAGVSEGSGGVCGRMWDSQERRVRGLWSFVVMEKMQAQRWRESRACCLCSDKAERLWNSAILRDGGFCPRQPWGPLLRDEHLINLEGK